MCGAWHVHSENKIARWFSCAALVKDEGPPGLQGLFPDSVFGDAGDKWNGQHIVRVFSMLMPLLHLLPILKTQLKRHLQKTLLFPDLNHSSLLDAPWSSSLASVAPPSLEGIFFIRCVFMRCVFFISQKTSWGQSLPDSTWCSLQHLRSLASWI